MESAKIDDVREFCGSYGSYRSMFGDEAWLDMPRLVAAIMTAPGGPRRVKRGERAWRGEGVPYHIVVDGDGAVTPATTVYGATRQKLWPK